MTEEQRRKLALEEMEARMARIPTKAVEQSPPVSEQPKPRVPDVTVESPVVQPVIDNYSIHPLPEVVASKVLDPKIPSTPGNAYQAPHRYQEEYPKTALDQPQKEVNWRDVGRRWKIGIAVFLVLLILVEMWFVLS